MIIFLFIWILLGVGGVALLMLSKYMAYKTVSFTIGMAIGLFFGIITFVIGFLTFLEENGDTEIF